MSVRGQFFSYDFIISLIVFLFFFTTFFFVWDYLGRQIAMQSGMSDMQASSALVSDLLVRTSGYPANWTQENVESIGLASEENVIDPARLQALNGTNYSAARNVLGLGQKYNIYLQINDTLKNQTVFAYGQGALFPSQMVIANRYVLYDNHSSSTKQRATLQVVLWS